MNRKLRRKAQEPCEDKFSNTFKWDHYTGTSNHYKSNTLNDKTRTYQNRYEIYVAICESNTEIHDFFFFQS